MVLLKVLYVDYPFLCGVINLLVLFSVCESWHCIVWFWNISLIEPQLNKHHKRDLIMTSVSDSTTRRSKKELPNIPPEELALHGNEGSLEGGVSAGAIYQTCAQKIPFIDRAWYDWVWKKVAGRSWKENVEPRPLLE